MAVTLLEAAKLVSDSLRRGVIESLVEGSPVLQALPFVGIDGTAYSYNREGALPGASFRAINAGYPESTGTLSKVTVALAALGGHSDTDTFLVDGNGGGDTRAAQTAMKAKATRMEFLNAFINGDVDANPNAFNGLSDVLTGTSQELFTATNGLSITGTSDADRQNFLDQLDLLIGAVNGNADMLLMNSQALARIRSSARRLTVGSEDRETFGTPVLTYSGVPMVDIGPASNGTQIIQNNQTRGTATNATSIYAVKFGNEVDGVVGLQRNGYDLRVKDLGEIEEKPSYRTRIDWHCGVAVHSVKSAAVLRGVIAS